MSQNEKEFQEKWIANFKKFNGGTKVDPEITTADFEGLGRGLQESFDKIFPELIKPSKHRKHVVFDDDVFQFFVGLCGDNGSKFSSMINSALRSFVKERINSNSIERDPISEFLSLREREEELLREIKELDLTEELRQKLG